MSWMKVAPMLWQSEPRGWVLMAYMRRGKPVLRYFLNGSIATEATKGGEG